MNIKYVCIICSLIKAYAAKDFKKLDFPVLENKHEWLVHGCVRVCGYAFVCICVYTRTYMYYTLFVSRSLSVALALAHYLSRTRARSLSLSLGLSLCLPVVSLSLSLSLSVCLSLSVSLAFSHQNPTLSQRLRTPSAGFRIRTTSLNSPLQALSTVRERMNIFII